MANARMASNPILARSLEGSVNPVKRTNWTLGLSVRCLFSAKNAHGDAVRKVFIHSCARRGRGAIAVEVV